MIYWLRHPNHGVKPCYAEAEMRADIANGWERFDPDKERAAKAAQQEEAQPVAVVEPVAEPVATQEPVQIPAEPKKRGRPATKSKG